MFGSNVARLASVDSGMGKHVNNVNRGLKLFLLNLL